MAKIKVNIRLDEDLKRQFKDLCADMGMLMTTAITIFSRKTVSEHRIPFEISSRVPNAETLAAMEEVQLMKADPNMGKTYSNVWRSYDTTGITYYKRTTCLCA